MCASDRSRQDDGRVLGQVIYLVIWYFRGGKLKLRQSVTKNWKLQTSSNTYLKCFLFPTTGVEHLKLYRVSLGDLFCFLWLRSDLRKMRFDVEELFTQLDFKLKSCAFFWSEGFSKICPKEFVVFFSFYIAVRDKFRIYQLPQVFGWIF